MAAMPARTSTLPVTAPAPAKTLQLPRCACPTEGVIDLLGKKWTLCLLACVANCGPIRFNRLLEELGGISPKTLSDTLQALQGHGVVERRAYAEVPPRVEYELTAAGRGLVAAIQPFMDWVAGHGAQAACCVPAMRPAPATPTAA